MTLTTNTRLTSNMEHNGYPSYDTWLVCIWLDSVEKVYFEVKNNKDYFLHMTLESLYRYLKRNQCTDKIDLSLVDEKTVYEFILEM